MKAKLILLMITLGFVFNLSAQSKDFNLRVSYDFENGAIDSKGNTTMTLHNAAAIVNDPTRGKVLSVDKTNKGYAVMPMCEMGDTITLSFWYKRHMTDDNAPWKQIFEFYNPTDQTNMYLMPVYGYDASKSGLVSNINGYTIGIWDALVADEIKADNAWNHVVIVMCDAYLSYYLNGKLAVKKKVQASFSTLDFTDLYWGINPQRSGFSYVMDASFDDIKIYRYPFSESQVLQLYNNQEVTDPISKEPITFHFDGNADEIDHRISIFGTDYAFVSDVERMQVLKINKGGQVNFSEQIFPTGSSTINFLYKKETISRQNDDGKYIYQSSNTNSSYGIRIRFKEDGKAYLAFENVINGAAPKEAVGKYEIEAGKWYAISLYYLMSPASNDKGTVRLYQNKVQTAAMASVETYSLGFDKWSLGSTVASQSAEGMYDELVVEEYAMTQSDINSYYASNLMPIQINVDYTGTQQTIRNFGSSDAWATQQIGLRWPQAKKERVAEMLFSKEFDEAGNPKGIGLSAWRFNIGAGSYEQGEASLIQGYELRTECFLNPDKTTYNWDKQLGQQWFMKKAVQDYDVEDLIGFMNSPPVYYTKHGYAFNKGGGKDYILADDKYDDFARFTADVIEHFKGKGIPFKYISPFNEPQYDWKENANGVAGQEGSPASNSQIVRVVKEMSSEFSRRNLDTQIFVGEAGALHDASSQVPLFWGNADPELKIAGLPNVSNIVSSHSYWNDGSAADIYKARAGFKNLLTQTSLDLEYFQTEYCLLGEGYRWGHPGATIGNYTEMECAMSVARMLHADMAIANATGWQWWTTFGGGGGESRYVLIEALTKKDFSDGVYHATKLFYTLGQYSRFIRPGMKRVNLVSSDGLDETEALGSNMYSAYIDEKEKRVVVIATNSTLMKNTINISIDNFPVVSNVQFIPYITSEDYNMQVLPKVNVGENFVLPPLSVVTFVSEPLDIPDGLSHNTMDDLLVYPNPAIEKVVINAQKEIKSVAVYGLQGNLLQKQLFRGERQVEIPVSGLSKGTYILYISTSDTCVAKKIVKI